MVWAAVLLGRVWCTVCPLELVSNAGERLARAAGIRQRVLARWVAAGWVVVALYALLQLLVATVHLNRTPAYTAWFLAGLLALAAVTGMLWKDRAFCRGFCPVGLLLGTYGRGGMLAVRPGQRSACRACVSKGCVKASNRDRWDGRSCPSLLTPYKLDSSRECLLCGQCLKSCDPGNMQLLLRRPFARSDARAALASWPVTLFVMLVSGFVAWELCAEWGPAEAVFLAAPTWLGARSGAVETTDGFLRWLWALLVVPGTVWLALACVHRLLGGRRRVGDLLRSAALTVAVVVSAGHMAKGLAKLVSWAPFLPLTLRDPGGVATVQAITARTLPPPAPLLGAAFVATAGAALVAAAVYLAAREHRLAHRQEKAWDGTSPQLIVPER
jgi:ferredoxin